jgi:ABC-2 type transport system permease protein
LVGVLEIYRKELAEHFRSKRWYILLATIYLIGFSLAFEAIGSITKEMQRTDGKSVFLRLLTTQAGVVPSFLGFLTFLGPLLGLILVFDSINREVSRGTLINVLAQPINRDSIIIGKFAAGLSVLSLILVSVLLLIIGMGVVVLGAFPTIEESMRLLIFLFISEVYFSLWISLGLLFSIFFEREGTAALASITTWLFFSNFIYMISDITSNTGVSPWIINHLSPTLIYTEASAIILMPNLRVLGPVSYEKIIGMLPGPLPIDQSFLLIWPHIVSLISVMFIIFIISYIKFIRLEIRYT